MIDKNIKRFCELVLEINTINKGLDKERADFYDGGRSFEECNHYKIEELEHLQDELKDVLKIVYKI